MSNLGKKTCTHSKGYSFDSNFRKLCQNVYLHEIEVIFEIRSVCIKN